MKSICKPPKRQKANGSHNNTEIGYKVLCVDQERGSVVSLSDPKTIKGTYLSDPQIERLKCMFSDEEKYKYYTKTIWLLRELSEKSCIIQNKKSISYDRNSQHFPILETMNELMACLLPEDGFFDAYGNYIKIKII